MNFTRKHDSSSRLIGLAFVIALHALLIYGLMVGLTRDKIEVTQPPIETRIIEEREAPLEVLPPPTPEITPPPAPSLPPPVLNIAPPPQIERKTITVTRNEPLPRPAPAPPTPPTPKAVVRVPPKVNFDQSPLACRQPAYPSISARLGEEGIAEVSLLISADGEKVLETRVRKSSGYKRLDEATLKAFRRCRFSPGTVDGKPEPSWFSVRYQWVVPR